LEESLKAVSASSTASAISPSEGRKLRKGRDSKELTLHKTISVAKFLKLSLVTPKRPVSQAPTTPPATPPPLLMDINVAKRVASRPGGQSFAARTRTGINDTCRHRHVNMKVIRITGQN
jgi:hypothetical protein